MNRLSQANLQLVSKCGLYCGNCKKYISSKCSGCEANEKASWCKVRACCVENGYDSCADCTTTNPRECKKFNNFISSFFELLFRSDRKASIDFIRENSRESFIHLMIDEKRMSIKK
ncbi:DUF3795 domain-containing protein [Sunxiuqinia indica]|uniref:DUF3795 domain-containing protein n=1 Tax=Sunxiuqinia indica TaxID=2692584 RepID=UPI001357D896|nr:DUF3795 domain-containing protein [Sunxiuqinia indica]